MRVVWAPVARQDLRSIHDFVVQDSPVAAAALVDAIDRAGSTFGTFPFKGHPGLDGTREWLVPRFRRYLLIYDVDGGQEVVTILRVWHQSRFR